MADKNRLDSVVMEHGFAESREKAKALIMAGQIFVNDQKALKAGTMVSKDDKIEFRGKSLPYVSRGGLKLKKAITEFNINLNEKTCMDVGASTGGFTDCMLQNGAKKVYSIDVGYGQLAWKLRCDDRVNNLERTNFRYLKFDKVGELIDFASVDVSFISLEHIFPNLNIYTKTGGKCVALIKPQFEAGRENVGKKGVVKDPKVHVDVINKVLNLAYENGFSIKGLTFSPIKGPEGNIEYLLFLEKGDKISPDTTFLDVEKIVRDSHIYLDVN